MNPPDGSGCRSDDGFTLAELLIALAILGVIATFTIPKVLSSQQNSKSVAAAKEVASMISGAYQVYQQSNTPPSTMRAVALSPYMNYVSVDTSGTQVDAIPTSGANTCDSTNVCIKLHNGGTLWFDDVWGFGGTASTNALEFAFDPDGQYSGSTADGPGKSVQFVLYYNGALTTRGQARSVSCDGGGCWGPNASLDPSWFSWN